MDASPRPARRRVIVRRLLLAAIAIMVAAAPAADGGTSRTVTNQVKRLPGALLVDADGVREILLTGRRGPRLFPFGLDEVRARPGGIDFLLDAGDT